MKKILIQRRKQYWQRIKSTFGSSIVAYYPMIETTGTVIKDYGPNGCNGAVINASLANANAPKGGRCPLFDGTGDGINIYSAGLNSAFNGLEGTIFCWVKVDPAAWTDGITRVITRMLVDENNYILLFKDSVNYRIQLQYCGGGGWRPVSAMSDITSTDWLSIMATWSRSNNRVRMFINGVQQTPDAINANSWVGSLLSTACNIGAYDTGGGNSWKGNISNFLILNREVSQSEMMPFFNPTSLLVDYLGGSITDGTAASSYSTTSWRALVGAYLATQNPIKTITNYNSGVGNTGSWHALFRLVDDILPKNPVMVLCDWGVNDSTGDFYRSTEEACIRRILTSCPNAAVYLPLFIVIANPAVDDATDIFATHHAELTALAAHYGLSTIDCITPIQTAVGEGTHLNTLIDGTVHPLDAGHVIYANAIKTVANTGLNAYPVSRGALPDRMYPNSELYENTPFTKLGTEYTSLTGSGWAASGGEMESSTENDTITFTGTFQSFGIYTGAYGEGEFGYSVDGGAETLFTTISPPAFLWSGTRGSHSVTFRVSTGTVNIAKFMAI